MRFAWIGFHPPAEHGSAAGRQLWAVGEALRADGHEVEAWCWRPGRPPTALPDWCTWRPLPLASAWRVRGRGLVRPRTEVARIAWTAPDDAVVVADDPGSWPAAAGRGRLAVPTVHFSVALDVRALRDRRPVRLQDLRGERRAVRQARTVWSLSDRVRDAVGRGVVVPACIPVPAAALPSVEEPVTGLLADWSWPANVAAVDQLVRCWPQVRAAVPGARLLLAGRGPSPVGALPGVEWRGEVASTADFLAEVGLFTFPCPPTSGPKMKVMDAMAHGVAVLTTTAGVEGIRGGAQAAAVADGGRLVPRLIELLRDPAARASSAAAGRAALVAGHAPVVAARARVAAAEQALQA